MTRRTTFLTLALTIGLIGQSAIASAAARPCEDVLQEFRAAKASSKVSADTLKKAEALEAKAVERCNADDDKRADQFLADASKLLGL